MLKRIHVNQMVIRSNKKKGTNEPVISIKTHNSNQYAHEVLIHGPSKVIYSPCKPLNCGATVWVETDCEVEIIR
jgi:hypothetical protein